MLLAVDRRKELSHHRVLFQNCAKEARDLVEAFAFMSQVRDAYDVFGFFCLHVLHSYLTDKTTNVLLAMYSRIVLIH